MVARLVTIVLCGVVAVVGCATKSYVNEQVAGSETKLTQQVASTQTSLDTRADSQEAKLREVAANTGENRQAIDTADQRLKSLDGRMTEVDARTEQATAAARDAEARLAQRLAGRNSYRVVDTKVVYFDSGRIDIRAQDLTTLDELARLLAADPNAMIELQGFADAQGSDRYNRELARERIEVVMRYLMQQHNIELRQMQGIPMGKVTQAAGEKPTPATMAQARRVDLRLLTPWSSWEDRTAVDRSSAGTPTAPSAASAAAEAPAALPREVQRDETPPALPREVQRTEAPPASQLDSPASARLPALLRTITPRDLGGD
jgi:outer membrane protein OmpA-like peptidoglycan-associated protein